MALNWFKKSGIKKRYLVLGLLAIELASLPAAAKIIESVAFSAAPVASVVLIDAVAGQTRYAVASNAPFHVKVDGIVGNISVTVHKSGQIGAARFGDNAQMPGAALTCTALTGQKNTVYQAERKTSFGTGDILSQAVIVSVQYDPAAYPAISPKISIEPGIANGPAAETVPCTVKRV